MMQYFSMLSFNHEAPKQSQGTEARETLKGFRVMGSFSVFPDFYSFLRVPLNFSFHPISRFLPV